MVRNPPDVARLFELAFVPLTAKLPREGDSRGSSNGTSVFYFYCNVPPRLSQLDQLPLYHAWFRELSDPRQKTSRRLAPHELMPTSDVAVPPIFSNEPLGNQPVP